jgi:hypothetical protein
MEASFRRQRCRNLKEKTLVRVDRWMALFPSIQTFNLILSSLWKNYSTKSLIS